VAKCFAVTTFNDFTSNLKDIYNKEEARIKTEHQAKEVLTRA